MLWRDLGWYYAMDISRMVVCYGQIKDGRHHMHMLSHLQTRYLVDCCHDFSKMSSFCCYRTYSVVLLRSHLLTLMGNAQLVLHLELIDHGPVTP